MFSQETCPLDSVTLNTAKSFARMIATDRALCPSDQPASLSVEL